MRRLLPCRAGTRLTVYERELRPGGHSHTVEIDYDGRRIAVDTGFIVYNELNYPDLTGLFDHLRVVTQPSQMSFSVSANGGKLEWMGGGERLTETLNGVFAQRSNLLSLPFLAMLRDMLRFNRQCLADRADGRLEGLSLGDYLRMARLFASPSARLSGADGRRDLVDAGRPDAGISGREFRRLLRQPSPAA